MLGYDAAALLFGMSSWTNDPSVYVKRFNPESHVSDFAVDLALRDPGEPFALPAPLVEGTEERRATTPTPDESMPETTEALNCIGCHTSAVILEVMAVETAVKSEKTAGEG
jgi:hypothetical protein